MTTEKPGIVGQPFRLKIGEPATPPTGLPAQCFVNIGPAESYDHAARWRSGCPATENPGSQAIYYRYTPDQTKSLRFTLTSPDAWEELYLWEDYKLVNQHSSALASCHDRCARFIHLLEAGKDYIFEVTSDGAAPGGRYLLSMRPTLAFSEPAPKAVSPAECRETIDDVDSPIRFGGGANGRFAWPCHSVERSGHYARYYTFTLRKDRDVRIELHGSQAAGASMFLREGVYGSGPYLGESHNPDGSARARIDGRLLAGTYTIEAVAAGPGDGGLFDVSIKEGPDTPAPPMTCVTSLGSRSQAVTVDRNSEQWNSGECASFARSGSPSRWYTFTLTSTRTVDIAVRPVEGTMTPADSFYSLFGSYLYLRAENAYSGLHIAESPRVAAGQGNTFGGLTGVVAVSWADSFMTVSLAAGTYVIEATTDRPGDTGQYALHFRVR